MIQSSENQTSKNQKNTKKQCHIVRITLLQTAFSAILPTGIIYTVDVIDGGFIESIICVRIGKKKRSCMSYIYMYDFYQEHEDSSRPYYCNLLIFINISRCQ